jgi:hypothetical protein
MQLFPTSSFGPISYFQEIAKYENVAIISHDVYEKQSERNRYAIATSQGMQWLTIPVRRVDGSKTITSRIEIDTTTDWAKKHWKALETAYNASPFFEHYTLELKAMLFQEETNLLRYNTNCLNTLLSLFDLETNVSINSEVTRCEQDYFQAAAENQIEYQQVLFKNPEFIPNLSILDLLCCAGPLGRKILV